MTAEAGKNHAARMDSIYRYQKHIYDLSRKFYLLGRDRLIDTLDVPPEGTVLEIGCGTGRNLLRVHKAFPDAQLHGLDISREMLSVAERTTAGSGCRAWLQQGDACRFVSEGLFGGQKFDRIFFSYALSMIPGWEQAIAEAGTALKHRGSLHIVDFGQLEDLPHWFKAALFRWLAAFHVHPRETLFKTIERQAVQAGTSSHCSSLYRGYAWHGVICAA